MLRQECQRNRGVLCGSLLRLSSGQNRAGGADQPTWVGVQSGQIIFGGSCMRPHCGERRLLPVARIVFRQIPEKKVRWAHAVVPYRADHDSPCTGQRDQEALLLARQHSREPRIMTGFVAFFKRSPQHELGKVFTTEHGVAPGEVRPHVLLDHRYPRIFPVASGRACRRGQCHRVFHRPYLGQGIGLHFHAPNLCHE